jgi:hypothetical protein
LYDLQKIKLLKDIRLKQKSTSEVSLKFIYLDKSVEHWAKIHKSHIFKEFLYTFFIMFTHKLS